MPIRPLRRRLSSRCTTRNAPSARRSISRAAAVFTSARLAPHGLVASAANPVPIPADRESTTRTAPSSSAAACCAAPSVLDNAVDRCTATTPSLSLSASAARYTAAGSAGLAPAVLAWAR